MTFVKNYRALLAVGTIYFFGLVANSEAAIKIAFIKYEGAATANGNFLTKIVARDAACSAASLFENTQAYDNVAGGATPTTASEIRDFIEIGLSATAPAGYTVTPETIAGEPFIRIVADDTAGGQYFDICVDGTKILGSGVTAPYVENGVTVSGFSKLKGDIPTVTTWGALAMALAVLAAASVVIVNRRREAAA